MKTTNLKVGMKVTTRYVSEFKDVVRTILTVEPNERCASGFIASADGGEVCKCCGFAPAKPINWIGSDWFEPVVLESENDLVLGVKDVFHVTGTI